MCQGDYRVTVPNNPPGLVPTTPLSSDGNDSGVYDSNNPAGTSVNLPSNDASNQNVDFGYVPSSCTGSIGNYVWLDTNKDGNQLNENGTTGLYNVQVKLTGTNIYGQSISLTTTTDHPGYYLFTGLCQGNYTVSIPTNPNGLVPTAPLSSNGDDGQVYDSNNPAGTAIFLPNNHASNVNVDFGYVERVCTGQIGNYVWLDTNRDGNQLNENGTTGLYNVQVKLTGTNIYGQSISLTTTTDHPGYYLFSGLCQGDYTVSIPSNPAGLVPTTPLSGNGNDGQVYDSNNPAGTTVNLPSNNAHNQDVDFGYVYPTAPASLGDRVWEDTNSNGIQDNGEPGIPGALVTLTDCNGNPVTDFSGNPVNPITTGSNGFYQFTNLKAGQYQVTFTLPGGYQFTLPYQTANTALDSNANPATGKSECVTLTSGQSNQTVDAGGVKKPASLGDRVWEDINGNGLQDNGEPGIPGVTVTLYNCDGTPTGKTAVTAANGNYLFSNLAAGSYYVVFSNLPVGYMFTTQNAGDDALDSDANPATGKSEPCVTLAPGESNLTVDAGLIKKPASLGDRVWEDKNGNGIQDPNEPGISGVKVDLYTCAGVFVATTPTNGNGFYKFENLTPGSYYVVFTNPDGTKYKGFTLKNAGTNQAIDSNADAAGKTDCVTLAPGEYNPTIDAGLIPFKCDLVLEKTCDVPSPPAGPFNCSDAKPIDSITMIWNGNQTVGIKAWKGSVGSTLLATITDIQPGEEVTVSGYAGSPNDVIWEIFNSSGSKLGNSTFHLSCSDADMNGPEDCGKAAGDGKGLSGYINNWIFDGMAGSGQVLDCTPGSGEPTNECVVQPGTRTELLHGGQTARI